MAHFQDVGIENLFFWGDDILRAGIFTLPEHRGFVQEV